MSLPMQLLVGWYGCINLIALVITVSDKRRARQSRRRVPERSLMLIGLLGGAPLMWATMLRIRHKTRHLNFMIAMPLMTLAHGALIGYLCTRIP